MFWRELQLPVDLQTRKPPGKDLSTDTLRFSREMAERLKEVHHQVQGCLKVIWGGYETGL